MPVTIQLKLTPAAQAVLQRLERLPATALQAIRAAMDSQNELTIGHIQTERLSAVAPKPLPPEQGQLRVVTSLLRRSLRRARARIVGQDVTSSIGTNIVYAGPHEFGATIHHEPRSGTVRLRVNKAGELLRQPGRAGAIFAKGSHKRVKEVAFEAAGHDVTIPARRPIRRGIEDRVPAYSEAISRAIVNAATIT